MGVCHGMQSTCGGSSADAMAAQKLVDDNQADKMLRLAAEDDSSGEKEKRSDVQELSPEAQEQMVILYTEYRRRLMRYLKSMWMGRDQAEEVVQETFMRLTTELLREKQIDNVQGWIVRVAHNLAVDALKSKERDATRHREITAEDQEKWADPAPAPDETYSRKEQISRMNDALSSLDPRHKQCFQLRAQGFRHKDIALALGISEQRAAFIVKQVAVRLAAICG